MLPGPGGPAPGVKSGVCMPIMDNDKVLGTMDFFATETLELKENRAAAHRDVARLASYSIRMLQVAEHASTIALECKAIASVIESVGRASTVEEAEKVALDSVCKAFKWGYGSFRSLDEADQSLQTSIESGSMAEEFRVRRPGPLPRRRRPMRRHWKARDLVFVPDLGAMSGAGYGRAALARKHGIHSAMCFPIMDEGKVVGTMDFFTTEVLELSDDLMDALRSVGRVRFLNDSGFADSRGGR